MPSVRDQITMSPAELERFFDEERVLTCASLGPNGRPHLMPLWYVRDGLTLLSWTFGKSQKVRNLERDPRATVQVEAGRDPARVTEVGLALARRYQGAGADPPAEARAAVARQAAKRVVLRFTPTHIVSWDHRKLGGAY